MLIVVKNITDHTTNNKEKQTNKLKAKAFHTLSHELKTPVHNIINSLKEIKNRPGYRDPIVAMYHKMSTSSSQILYHKIGDILDYTLAEQRKLVLNPEQVQIKKVFSDIVETFEYQARLKGLNFYVYIDDDIPDYINTDV